MDTNTKKASRPRGAAYQCAVCNIQHEPTAYPEQKRDAEGYFIPLKGDEAEQWSKATSWKYHKRYAVGTSGGESAAYLLRLLKPGDEVQTILRHRSRSGMMRHISTIAHGQDISGHVAAVVDWKRADDGGVKVSGCGMDTGFHLVYSLASCLWPNGFSCAGDRQPSGEGGRCPSNDHSNGDRNYKPHLHTSGGYALRQRWL